MSGPEFLRDLEIYDFISENLPIQSIKTIHGDINFLMFGETTEFRVRTFHTKEPETLAWIDTFSSGDVFWDVGANIGCYSLYAGLKGNVAVCSFEPSPANFYLLAANLGANNIQTIDAYPFGLSRDCGVIKWKGLGSPGEAGEECQISRSGKLALQVYSIDQIVNCGIAPFPNHIKLDVDGIESEIIDGAINALTDNRLKSIMVEVDESNQTTTNKILNTLEKCGFSDPVRRHAPYFDKNYYLPGANFLFLRKP